MRITIFGATGRTGQLLVRQALDAGHAVTAYARNPDKLRFTHPELTVAAGELDDEKAILEAVRGADAVIEGVGSESAATRRIIAAMDASGVGRFVVVSTCSVPDPADRPDLKFKALVRFVRTAAPRAWSEVRAAAEAVRASDLDWTLVRVAKLDDGPATGEIKVGHYGHGVVGLSLRRADMASFLLAQVTDRTHLREAPAISN
ncbi:NAD(P)-dependent oxidoreductase [Streptomyces sp. NBC_00102]|uniref:NAD(P)-dependent oxidoreductase n=1 Tax=Streptomyces sp. NBC_00102 TaxID=2975652 RepID=UPI00225499A3|nr:NAD(P)H-binding protein [Streptomyces sp. NBC_00102]MCX5400572.1 NAD(P)H-binding protein [Streptomyces sp. NBC_00102]